jgi:hypothetical protein
MSFLSRIFCLGLLCLALCELSSASKISDSLNRANEQASRGVHLQAGRLHLGNSDIVSEGNGHVFTHAAAAYVPVGTLLDNHQSQTVHPARAYVVQLKAPVSHHTIEAFKDALSVHPTASVNGIFTHDAVHVLCDADLDIASLPVRCACCCLAMLLLCMLITQSLTLSLSHHLFYLWCFAGCGSVFRI